MIYKQPSGNAGEYYPAFFEMRLRPCVSDNISRADSRIFSVTLIRTCLLAG